MPLTPRDDKSRGIFYRKIKPDPGFKLPPVDILWILSNLLTKKRFFFKLIKEKKN